MASIYTDNFETGSISPFSASGGAAISTTQAHTATHSASFTANTGTASYIRRTYTNVATGTRVFFGYWLWLTSVPTGNLLNQSFLENASFGAAAGINIDTSGRILLVDSTNATIVTGPVIAPSTWTNIEYSAMIPVSGSTANVQLVVNSTDYGTGSATVGTSQINSSRLGYTFSPSPGITVGYLDDITINDDTTGSNNSWPSGFTPGITAAAWAACV